MYPTVEARWFFPGPLPAAARDWFGTTGRAEPELQQRADLYLVSLAADAPNVKLRAVDGDGERRLEIKTRAGTLRTQTFGAGHAQATGRVGKWQKWRLSLADSAPAAETLAGSSDWLRVEKRRRSQVFQYADGHVAEAAGPEQPAIGCDLELSEIGIGQARYWSVCFEAFGPSHDGLEDALRETATHALSCGRPPALPAGRSLGYPELLARLAQGAR